LTLPSLLSPSELVEPSPTMMDNGDGKTAESKDCGPTENELKAPSPPMPPVHEVITYV